jgi:hypothetical protein
MDFAIQCKGLYLADASNLPGGCDVKRTYYLSEQPIDDRYERT